MTLPSRRGALHTLALIATDDSARSKFADYHDNRKHHPSADIRIQRLCNPGPPILHDLPNLHLSSKPASCPTDPKTPPKHCVSSQALAEESISSASASSSSSLSTSSFTSAANSGRTTRSSNKKKHHRGASVPSTVELSRKQELRNKRAQMLEKAKKINSLDNSPANERQLLVLRMVYEEITMYPTEPWMAILAIIIHRSLKQVKNWFSNERQKRGTGEETTVVSSSGEKYRVRPISSTCEDWSDEWFEEIVMIHHYRVLCNSQLQARALSDTSSNYDGRS